MIKRIKQLPLWSSERGQDTGDVITELRPNQEERRRGLRRIRSLRQTLDGEDHAKH